MSETTQTTHESTGVLDTLEAKFDAFEERIGLDVYTAQTNATKAVLYYTMSTMLVGSAAASPTASPAAIGDSICAEGLGDFISNLLGLLLAVGFIGAIYAMVRSGLKYMNAGGDPEKKSQAREALMMSFFGAGIILFVTFLPAFLNSLLTSTEITTCFTPF